MKKTNKNKRILIFQMLHLKKNTWRYHYFTPVYQKSWWYDLQFLRYRVWQTKIGNYWPSFALLLLPCTDLKNQNFEKMKSCWRYYHFTRVAKTTITWCIVTGILSVKNIFLILVHFLTFYHQETLKIKILKKWKNS